ncbi:MAG: AAA family ATPase, partial [Muribaculaceae bacterium]|nr:AAA family ATPase [Muribaculaceae bacterium]
YINKIHINDLFHLHDLTIKIDNPSCSNLIITGKNGSGKTVLLNAITNKLEKVFPPKNSKAKVLADSVLLGMYKASSNTDKISDIERAKLQFEIDQLEMRINSIQEVVELSFENPEFIVSDYQRGDFIVAYYSAARKTTIQVPVNPTKPDLYSYTGIRENLTSQLLYFLSDLKIQEALARNENQIQDAERINQWLRKFENILKSVFGDKNLQLKFNYRDYSFLIITNGKAFGFTQLSDGFVAVLEIVADLILRMQPNGSISSEFNKPGIVLIDEVETHLHLQLQKEILPMLTTLFPNIQFIVTTHSPFVLSSLPNATAYDLEHKEPISNLSEFSYQALTEGYFGVKTASDYALKRFDELKSLLEKPELSIAEKMVVKQLIKDMRKIPEASAPELVGAYRQLEIEYFDKITKLGA